jgi:hypothetical protein
LFTLDVDGERFATRRAAWGQGGTFYDWLSGPNKGYGFGSSGTPNRPVEEHRESIRAFLAMIDPLSTPSMILDAEPHLILDGADSTGQRNASVSREDSR